MEPKYNHIKAEEKNRELWAKDKIYSMASNFGPIYNIDTPPPTVSGAIHIGHIFSYTQTDVIARFKRMSGFSVFYPFGFDDNGLATERFVEKKLNVSSHRMSRSEFIALCLQETKIAEKDFEDLFKKIGLSVDWTFCYSTIDEDSRRISQASFIELFKKNYIYRKNEPAIYCTTCKTTVAQAELDDIEKSALFLDIIFKSQAGDLIISTTRPELLPSVSAILYHPDDSRYKHLKNVKAFVPIFNREIPILEDTAVVLEKGTGLVMVSSFGDKQDILWVKKHNLPYLQSVATDGTWTKITGPLTGLHADEARKEIIRLLKEQNLIVKEQQIKHSVNVHERCKKEIEYLILPQWFLKILPYKSKFLELADQINWFPEFMKSRYKNWVENISWDWCLSRQRFYGIPFPVWHCVDCNEILLASIEDLPVDPQETKYNGNCTKCSGNNIVPDTDVMDTWNTSSLTPYICKNLFQKQLEEKPLKDFQSNEGRDPHKFLPMSLRPQAHDIIRTWAFYTIVKSYMHANDIPWRDIVISGHVLSDQKEKISKSKANNPLAPENLLQKYSADSIRYWTASGGLGHDISFSESQILIGQKLVVKLWNAFRFIYGHIEQGRAPVSNILNITNQWILHKISLCYKKYKNHLDNYEFSLALNDVDKFFWNDFCDNYLEIIKDQLFNKDKYSSQVVQETIYTLYKIGIRILQLYAPYLPFVTEEIYNVLYKQNTNVVSVHQTKFEQYQILFDFADSARLMEIILKIIAQVRKLKSEHKLSLKTELNNLMIYSSNADILKSLKVHETLIKGVTQAKIIIYVPEDLEQPNLLHEEQSGQAPQSNAKVSVEYAS